MNRLKLILFFIGIVSTLNAQDVKVYERFEDFEKDFITNSEKPTVINFWATWCAPCVAELPYFMEWYNNQKGEKINLVLVSLDMKKHIDKKVIPFLKRKNINVKTVLLADGKAHKWIDKVDPEWSGAIPATLFINGTKKQFAEKEYHSTKELADEISAFFNK